MSALIWLISLFVPRPWRFALWNVAIPIEIGNGPIAYATVKRVPQQVSHMDERFVLLNHRGLGRVGCGSNDRYAGRRLAVAVGRGGYRRFYGCCTHVVDYFDWSDSSVINQALRSDRRDWSCPLGRNR